MKIKKALCVIMAALMTAAILSACNAGDISASESSQASSSESVVSEKEEFSDISNDIFDDVTSEQKDTQDSAAKKNDSVETVSTLDLSSMTFFTDRDLSNDYDEENAVKITCSDSAFKVEGDGAKADGNVLTISKEGVYIVSGTIKNGRIVIEAGEKDKVQLVLNGASITCSDNAAIYVKTADKVFVTTAKGTKNTITDGKTYKTSDDDSSVDSAIYSKTDLVINGSGELTVTGNMSHAIVSKDDLKITGGTIKVTAVDSAVIGKDSVRFANADLTVTSGGDGVKSTNTEKDDKGYVYIESGKLNVTSENDAIVAKTAMLVLDAEITAKTGGGSDNSQKTHSEGFGGRDMMNFSADTDTNSADDTSTSAKGLKSGGSLDISGKAKITLDCADDTIHAAGDLTIKSGTITVSSGDDGIHSDENVVISGGTVTVSKSYEGIEGKSVTVSGGDVSVTASDDGLNASDGSGSEDFGGFNGQKPDGMPDMNFGSDTDVSGFGGFNGQKPEGMPDMDFGSDTERKDFGGFGGFNGQKPDGMPDMNNGSGMDGNVSGGFNGQKPDGMPNMDNTSDTERKNFGGFGGQKPDGMPDMNSGSSTDGNAAGGFSGNMGGGMMMPGDTTSEDVFVLISGGTLKVNAGGDGLDSNGKLKVTGGTIYVDGPTNSGNGALDSGNGAVISGGTIIAVGSSGMAETFGSDSTQASILYNLSENHSAGETITLKDSSGKALMEYKAAKEFSSVVISTPELKSSGKYTLTVGSKSYDIEMTSVSYSNGGTTGGNMGGGFGGRGGFGNNQGGGSMPSNGTGSEV